jgi:hypothetical protein
MGGHTLRTSEGAVLRALGEGLVEVGGEGGIRDSAEGIVLHDELLEHLATVEKMVSKDVRSESRRLAFRFGSVSTTRYGKYLRATIAVLEL